jgi:hypothetical protein
MESVLPLDARKGKLDLIQTKAETERALDGLQSL